MIEYIPIIIEKVFQYGVFAALFILLLGAVLYFVWQIGLKISDHVIITLTSISDTNKKFADSSIKMADLVEVLIKQTESTLDQLKFIKTHLYKQNMAAVEVLNIIKLIPKDNNPEINIRLDNVAKELQRPIDE
jgi:hypothetical protein